MIILSMNVQTTKKIAEILLMEYAFSIDMGKFVVETDTIIE